MVDRRSSKPELEARPQHRASEHIRVDEKPGFSGKSDRFPRGRHCYEKREQFCRMAKVEALLD